MNSKLSGYAYKDITIFSKPVQQMSWSIDGNLLATAGNDKAYKILQIEPSGVIKAIQNIPSVSGGATQIKWHPSEKQRFAVAGDDVLIDLWDVRAPKPSARFTSSGNNLFLAWSQNSKYLASINKNDILTVFDVVAGKTVTSMKFEYEVNEFVWSCNSDYFLVASGLGGIEIASFHEDTLSRLDFVQGHTCNCHQLELYDPSSKPSSARQDSLIALGGSDFQVTLWDVNDVICHTTISLESEVRGISLSPDGHHLAIASEEAAVLFFSTWTGKQVYKADSRTPSRNLAWHPTSNIIAVAPDTGASAYLRLLTFNTSERS